MQDRIAIHRSRLYQCDIWAYGLLIWETFLQGAAYFDSKWRTDPNFVASPGPSEIVSASASAGPQSLVLDNGNFEPYLHDCFGNFDMRLIEQLAVSFISQIDDPAKILQEAQIIAVIHQTLAYDASQRAYEMSSLKIFDQHQKVQPPPANLAALRPEQVKLSFEMFICTQKYDLFWDFQQEVYNDIRRLAESTAADEASGLASFQVGLCHIEGFGCQVDASEAAIWFAKAQKQGHPLASFLVSQLSKKQSKPDTSRPYTSYTSAILSGPHIYPEDRKPMPTSATDNLEAVSDVEEGTGDLLVQACQEGDIDAVMTLLKAGVELENSLQSNLFHWLICIEDHLETLERQLRAPSEGEHRYRRRHTAILVNRVCQQHYTVHPQWPLRLTGTPLAFAIMVGSNKCVQFLLDFGADASLPCFDSQDDILHSEYTPINLAIQYHHQEILSTLLTSNASQLSIQTFSTALSNALPTERLFIHGKSAVEALNGTITLLDEWFPDLFVRYGSTCLEKAIARSDLFVVRALLRRWPRLLMQRLTIREGEAPFFFPLHFAAQIAGDRPNSQSMTIMKAVCWSSAAVMQRDSKGQLPIHLAARGRHCDALRWLLEKDQTSSSSSKVSYYDFSGRTPLHEAGCREALEVLVSHQYDIDGTDAAGQTLAHLACIHGEQQILAPLIEMKANLNIQDALGNSPLHYAVLHHWTDLVDMLMAAKVNQSLTNKNNETAFQLADTDRARWLEIATIFRPTVATDRLRLERILALAHRLKKKQEERRTKRARVKANWPVYRNRSPTPTFFPPLISSRDLITSGLPCLFCNGGENMFGECVHLRAGRGI
jgi:ankyrin repeat protein